MIFQVHYYYCRPIWELAYPLIVSYFADIGTIDIKYDLDDEDAEAVAGLDSDDPDFDPLEEQLNYRTKRARL
jgi:hypothetical protein